MRINKIESKMVNKIKSKIQQTVNTSSASLHSSISLPSYLSLLSSWPVTIIVMAILGGSIHALPCCTIKSRDLFSFLPLHPRLLPPLLYHLFGLLR